MFVRPWCSVSLTYWMRFIKGSQVNTGKATHIEFKSDYYETQWKIVLRFLCKCRLRVQCPHPGPCDWDNNHVRYMIRYTQTSLSPATSFSSSKGNQGSPLSMSWVCPGASYWWLMPWTPHLRGAQEASWSSCLNHLNRLLPHSSSHVYSWGHPPFGGSSYPWISLFE